MHVHFERPTEQGFDTVRFELPSCRILYREGNYTDEEIKATAQKNPSKRLGEVEDTVNAVLFLLSEKADYINGENLNVNGGILLV